jgi:REase_MTES_1575/Transcriptional regulator, AbiEi antitoxin
MGAYMRPKRRSHHRLAAVAGGQHGIVSLGQLRQLDYAEGTIKEMLKTGRLQPLARGVYGVGHKAIQQHGRCLSAVISCEGGALLSHRSAAWLWGLTKRFAVPIEVTAASPRRNRDEILVHSAGALIEVDHASFEGIPVTAVPRTLLDFASLDPFFLDHALESAYRLELLDLVAIDALIARSRGFRGVARLRTALEAYRTPAFLRSGVERRFLRLVEDHGLPRPSMNFFAEGYELDAYWPAERFAVELDTYDYHGSPRAFEEDRIRQEDLKLAGVELTRITGTRLNREPKRVMQRLASLLSRRRAQLGLPTPSPQN